jgi:membrane protein DedA with SNARE-associated domain
MSDAGKSTSKRLGPAGWFAIAVMTGFLLWAGWYALHAWNALDGVEVSTAGWIFIAAGVVFTLALGAGLMALVFYSSREGMDR